MTDRSSSTMGSAGAEARDVQDIFVSSFIAFASIVIVAQILVWLWRPWL